MASAQSSVVLSSGGASCCQVSGGTPLLQASVNSLCHQLHRVRPYASACIRGVGINGCVRGYTYIYKAMRMPVASPTPMACAGLGETARDLARRMHRLQHSRLHVGMRMYAAVRAQLQWYRSNQAMDAASAVPCVLEHLQLASIHMWTCLAMRVDRCGSESIPSVAQGTPYRGSLLGSAAPAGTQEIENHYRAT
nr:unnamed protein product [Rangifer tarandus platyrhynchus]